MPANSASARAYFAGVTLPEGYQEPLTTVTHNLINGSDGTDRLTGSNANDEINGLAADDTIQGGFGNDILHGGDGNDHIFGNQDNDTLNGGAGNDYLSGQDGDDVINGGDGNDNLIGINGSDTLTGGAGNDTFGFTSLDDTGVDLILDFNPAEDRVSFYPNYAKGAAGFHHLADTTFQGVSGTGIYWDSDPSDADPGRLLGVLQGWTTSQLSIGAAYFAGVSLPEGYQEPLTTVIHHVINGTDGTDRLTGSNANDEINGLAANDTIQGGFGNDILHGGDGNDFIYGNQDNDTLNGGAGNDYLSGQGGDDVIDGGEGNDNLIGSNGSDTLSGGAGNDTFGFTSLDDTGVDLILDFNPAEDRISFYPNYAKGAAGFHRLADTTFQGSRWHRHLLGFRSLGCRPGQAAGSAAGLDDKPAQHRRGLLRGGQPI